MSRGLPNRAASCRRKVECPNRASRRFGEALCRHAFRNQYRSSSNEGEQSNGRGKAENKRHSARRRIHLNGKCKQEATDEDEHQSNGSDTSSSTLQRKQGCPKQTRQDCATRPKN